MTNDLVLHFRELQKGDIPRIEKMCKDIWEGDDYLPQIISHWLQDENAHNYGAFLDSQRNELVGTGRVKWLSPTLGWIEGGRVASSYQNQGVGYQISKYAIEYAKNQGAKSVQFDTWTENKGSCALAKAHGFSQKNYIDVMYAKKEELHLATPSFDYGRVKTIGAETAFQFLKSVENGPKEEINMGWSYIPFALSYLQKNEGKYLWKCNDTALIQIHQITASISTLENPKHEIWITLFGNPEAAKEILNSELNHFILDPSFISVEIFFPSSFRPFMGDMGFHWVDFPHPSGIVLFAKNF